MSPGAATADPHARLIKNLRALARKNRWSANRLADFSGLSRAYVSQILSGKKSPTLRTMMKLAAAFEVDVVDLLES